MSVVDPGTDKAAAGFLAQELERLTALPLDTSDDVARWNIECAKVQTELETRFPTFEVEHHLYHFFDDSDIRQRDADYRQRQNKTVLDYVGRLRRLG